MFNMTNYYQQSLVIPAQNSLQITILELADLSTALREITKLGTVVGLVSSASSVVFNFDPTLALACTAVCGTSWLLTRKCAQYLEPEAQEIIQHFKDLKDGTDRYDVNKSSPSRAASCVI